MNPHVQSVGWSVSLLAGPSSRQSVYLHNSLKRQGNYTSKAPIGALVFLFWSRSPWGLGEVDHYIYPSSKTFVTLPQRSLHKPGKSVGQLERGRLLLGSRRDDRPRKVHRRVYSSLIVGPDLWQVGNTAKKRLQLWSRGNGHLFKKFLIFINNWIKYRLCSSRDDQVFFRCLASPFSPTH